MNTYLLIEGALVHGALSEVPGFRAPDAAWLATLLPGAARLAGPVLLSQQGMLDAGHDAAKAFAHWVKAYPCGLHASYLDSALDLPALAAHLSRHLRIVDDDGSLYALRLADCRVLATLPKVLDARQWAQLTAPLRAWTYHQRDGTPAPLRITPPAVEDAHDDEPLRLTSRQLDALVEFAEPDALLAAIGQTPDLTASRRGLAWLHRVARHCLKTWRESGHTSRDLLHDFALQAIRSNGALLDDPAQVRRVLGTRSQGGA